MARKALIAVLALLPAVFVVATRAQNAAGVQETPWLPLKEGNKWHYRVLEDGPNRPRKDAPRKADDPAKKVVIRVDKVVQVDFARDDKAKSEKVPAYRLVGTSEERELIEHVAVLPDGIWKFAGSDKDMTPPLRIFKLPAAARDSWDAHVRLEGGPAKGTFTTDEETVKIGKDSWNTLHVHGDFTIGAQKMTADYWFASGVGIVKYKVQRGTFHVTLELEKFEPAK